MSELTTLLGTANITLNATSGTAVIAPSGMAWKSETIVVAVQTGDLFVGWRRGVTSAATATALQLEGQQSMPFKANPGQTIFYAKAISGTPTLEIEFYG